MYVRTYIHTIQECSGARAMLERRRDLADAWFKCQLFRLPLNSHDVSSESHPAVLHGKDMSLETVEKKEKKKRTADTDSFRNLCATSDTHTGSPYPTARS